MSLNNKLITFASQELVLTHNETERERIKASLAQLEKVLKDKLGVEVRQFLRFGSFTCNTILPRKYDPHSDIDLMVIFNTTNGKLTPESYRRKLMDVITKAYPNSISKKDFPVVKLELNYIMFDIVPAYISDVWWTSYYIPDSSGGWRETSPNDVNEKLSNENQRYGNNTVRNVVRLAKHWNAMKNYPFESYSMEKEILGLSFSGDDTYSGFRHFLNRIAYRVSGVTQALEYLETYRRRDDYNKQYEWLQKLLPGLK